MQLVPLMRRDWRWHAAQIAHLALVLLASLGAMYFSDDFIWVIIAWTLFGIFVLAPRLLVRAGNRHLLMAQWKQAARWWQVAGRLVFGPTGRLYRRYATVLAVMSEGRREEADRLLDELIATPMPETVRGMVRLWKLSLLHICRDWPGTVTFYEGVEDWGTLSAAMHARLLAARAFAETGQVERALRSLQLVALSPRTIGPMEQQFWMTRVCVVALAGDDDGLEQLLQHREHASRLRRFPQFAAYWRGRCALARSDRTGAMKQFARAYALTHPRNRLWRGAITQYLQKTETGELPATFTAQNPSYAHGCEVLRMAEQQAAGWRALMHFGRPAPVTLALLVVLATVYLVDDVLFTNLWHSPLWLWAGNTTDTLEHGEWWRVITTLFLHANPLHLAMNGLALWMFGSAVEKTMGWWRFLVLFLVAGSLGNLLSAFNIRYDVAVGASGGIFGLVGAFAAAVYRLDAPMYASVRRRLLLMLALMVSADFSIGWLEPQIDNLAHVGGFFAGIALALVMYRPARPTHLHVHTIAQR